MGWSILAHSGLTYSGLFRLAHSRADLNLCYAIGQVVPLLYVNGPARPSPTNLCVGLGQLEARLSMKFRGPSQPNLAHLIPIIDPGRS